MRTTLEEHATTRRGNDTAHDDQDVARDNPRRQREPDTDREDEDRHWNVTSRSPRRHAVQD
jgi:hypothetical protein